MDRIENSAQRDNASAGGLGALLFLAIFMFFWITTTPFVDLTGAAAVDPSAGNSNLVNQLVTLVLSGSLLAFGLSSPMRSAILQPRGLLISLFIWYILVSALSAHPDLALKRVVLAIMVCVNASVFLLLPKSDAHFGKLLALATLIMLGFAYFGVIFLPLRAIHQASELREPMNAGFWRGQYAHKNEAAAVMVAAVFFGLFVYSVGQKLAGAAIIVLSTLFLLHTGGKTSTAALPGILILAWIFQHWKWTRFPIAIGGIVAFNVLAIGSAVFEPIRSLINAVGIDATFTNRTDIWRFAFSAIAQKPITGYGFQSFWQTEELVYSGGNVETWAVAAYNGHNGYLDTLLTTGIPGLILTVIWLLFLPLRDIGRADATGNNPALTTLFVRIWLYGIYTACVESMFFQNGSPLWFALLFAVFGLRLQARASVVSAAPSQAKLTVAHA
ncbi:O-antigen ligase family protein [Phyllobacterium meliloti]|uniref:O-antigen ligase family protein n=1 Tax=Phyllobacterium meliloti TaxID=555317 RepID=UPI001D13DACE|nr:O-antigen ligase [Phyllobacterium sp. T1293]UGX86200.1 O-antigen ligase family protein [Phyllobacterium sp. T1293]